MHVVVFVLVHMFLYFLVSTFYLSFCCQWGHVLSLCLIYSFIFVP
uniref:Uncharacterized protein n=1 Tax=Arundo donax TaxID=35708 RepID=A0A0A8YB12_ARUDO